MKLEDDNSEIFGSVKYLMDSQFYHSKEKILGNLPLNDKVNDLRLRIKNY